MKKVTLFIIGLSLLAIFNSCSDIDNGGGFPKKLIGSWDLYRFEEYSNGNLQKTDNDYLSSCLVFTESTIKINSEGSDFYGTWPCYYDKDNKIVYGDFFRFNILKLTSSELIISQRYGGSTMDEERYYFKRHK